MISRYHLDLAVIALALGVVVLVATMRAPVLGNRAVAVAGAVGAMLGSLTTSGGVIWVISAVLVVWFADDARRPHPLGRPTLLLAVVALAGIWTGVPDTEPPIAAGLVLFPVAVRYFVTRRPPGPTATLAVVIAMTGAVWTGSAGWGSALATLGAVGLIASAPLTIGFRPVPDTPRLALLVGSQFLVGALLPRFVAFRSVPMAVGVSVGVNLALVVVAFAVAGRRPRRSSESERT